jgi:hypothetical protein
VRCAAAARRQAATRRAGGAQSEPWARGVGAKRDTCAPDVQNACARTQHALLALHARAASSPARTRRRRASGAARLHARRERVQIRTEAKVVSYVRVAGRAPALSERASPRKAVRTHLNDERPWPRRREEGEGRRQLRPRSAHMSWAQTASFRCWRTARARGIVDAIPLSRELAGSAVRRLTPPPRRAATSSPKAG